MQMKTQTPTLNSVLSTLFLTFFPLPPKAVHQATIPLTRTDTPN